MSTRLAVFEKYHLLRHGTTQRKSQSGEPCAHHPAVHALCWANLWAWDGFAVFGGAVLDVEDFLVRNLFLPLGWVYLLFCVTRYGWGWQNNKEVNTGEVSRCRTGCAAT